MERHKAYIQTLSSAYMLDLFNKDVETVKPKGFGIYYNGQQIKPTRGNVESYPSINAALDALDRNSSVYHEIKAKLMYDIHGWNWNTNKEAYQNYYYKPFNQDGTSNGFLNDEVWEEYKALGKAASNAMKHFVKQWLKEGVLEIKQVI